MLQPVYNSGHRGVISTLCNPNLTEFTRMTIPTIETILDLSNSALTDVKLIPLSQGKFAIVDAEDYDWAMQWKWHYHNGYAVRNRREQEGCGRCTIVRLHRMLFPKKLLEPPKDVDVDHINGNRSDNRRCNLRLCTRAENVRNRLVCVERKKDSPKFKGVYKHKHGASFFAQIVSHGRIIYLGIYDTEIEAARAYNDGAIKHHGEFARLNIIEE